MDEHSLVGGPGNKARARTSRAQRARLWPLLSAGSLLVGCGAALPQAQHERQVEVIAHQGGRGLALGDSLGAFQNALDLGVDSLDLDVVLGKAQGEEGQAGYQRPAPLVWSDLVASSSRCRGQFAGLPLKNLTFAQVQTLVCDNPSPAFPGQKASPGSGIALLQEVFNLVNRKSEFVFDIDIRTTPNDSSSSAPEQAVESVLAEAEKDHREGQIRIKSFDWRNLALAKKRNPRVKLVALYDERTFFPGSPWLGPVRYDAAGGDPVNAAQQLGASFLSPCYTPEGCAGEAPPRPGAPLLDKDLVDRAHAAGLQVVPWTVNDEKAMAGLVDLGVDGIVTDYPDRLRAVLAEKGIQVPDPYEQPVMKTLQKNPPGLEY